MAVSAPPTRVLRVIARMNIGGPAHHVSLLSGRLDPDRYESLLAVGRPSAAEGSFEELARAHGARLVTVPGLGPEIRPLHDLRALWELVRLARRERPQIVHTHTAKAGLLGRLAALTVRPRPRIVHTFHGHVLEGYFGPAVTWVYRTMERLLARATDRIVAVSEATADDLVRLGVAPRERFTVIPLGLDLAGLRASGPESGAAFRAELGVGDDVPLLGCVGRLVPIKRVDVLLDAMARLERDAVLAVVGDGELRAQLESRAAALGLAERVRFLGFRTDLVSVFGGLDLVVLSSDNEGTPVSLIEAAAAGVPALATDVGGVREVVRPGAGRLVRAGDPAALAAALEDMLADRAALREMGERARATAADYTAERLLADVDRLYAELLGASGA